MLSHVYDRAGAWGAHICVEPEGMECLQCSTAMQYSHLFCQICNLLLHICTVNTAMRMHTAAAFRKALQKTTQTASYAILKHMRSSVARPPAVATCAPQLLCWHLNTGIMAAGSRLPAAMIRQT